MKANYTCIPSFYVLSRSVELILLSLIVMNDMALFYKYLAQLILKMYHRT